LNLVIYVYFFKLIIGNFQCSHRRITVLQIIITALNSVDASSNCQLGEIYEDLLAICDYEEDGYLLL
jgi:hypothetical protein